MESRVETTERPLSGRLARALVLREVMDRTEPLPKGLRPAERRRLREAAGFAPGDVATVLDVTERTFTLWESGAAHGISPQYRQALGAFAAFVSLGLKCDDILGTRRHDLALGRRSFRVSESVEARVLELHAAGLAAQQITESLNGDAEATVSLSAVRRALRRTRQGAK